MSMIRCDECERIFDSDEDPDCYVEKPNYINTSHPVKPAASLPVEWDVICEQCREGAE